ncbi:ketoisovalerate oxidoreductase [Rhodoblastus sphagnicola]|uniref:Ketoisovalerate oxidoreductase n=1 Tax=Rhodoblastus sphagnicola TaxID=333368 RepID=A0A2S6N002_9HYPH|nr:2-oxoacid:acceptor oxidoreductase family protein [Rhodoblastus sphagnicola]MBB4197896.1 pyruvate ferredoxin oxidoreductase gamma subunit/phenylglyoxylate dehydrogenase gamma subunit [Rhodoblastus sphagnicola]PPQ27955.1 ketoisovalerate oxidoreductase [Rhodoblastus sphagnicola]
MYEVRLHGRGGQGAVMAATMLASGVVAEGRFAVAIPSFGFERRGAPVAAFVRIDDREIRRMTNITHPDCVMCIDPTLSRSVDIFAGLKPGGALVQATEKPLSDLVTPETVAVVGVIDAVRIALDIFGRPITNTLMLGALARATGLVTLEGLKRALAHSEFRDAGLRQNLIALERGFHETAVQKLKQAAA